MANIESELELKASIPSKGAPFYLTDPVHEVTFRCWTAEEAVAKAQERGLARFAFKEDEGLYRQVNKVHGLQWWVRGGDRKPSDEPLADLQEMLDREALRAIEKRAQLRERMGVEVSWLDEAIAVADVDAFRRIQSSSWRRENAAVEIANNARSYPSYKKGLDEYGRIKLPHGPIAQAIYDLDAANDRKIAEKEDRKALSLSGPEEGGGYSQFRVWPDGAIQAVEDGELFSHRSDDFMVIAAPDEGAAGEKFARMEALSRLEGVAGASYTFWQIATQIMREQSRRVECLNWDQVHREVIHVSVGQKGQEPQVVLEALRLHSPGASTDAELAQLKSLVEQVSAEALAARVQLAQREAGRTLG